MFYRTNAFDHVEPWPLDTPLPIICLEDIDPHIGTEVDLLRATWTTPTPLVKDTPAYLRYWIALGQAVCLDPRECPFVVLTSKRLDALVFHDPEWVSFQTRLRRVPKRAEWLWVNPTGRVSPKPNRKPLREHPDWVPVRGVGGADLTVAVVRIRAIQKKWLRLIPFLQPIHMAVCTMFRAYAVHLPFFRTTKWVDPVRYHNPSFPAVLGYTVQTQDAKIYDYNGIRSILKSPLSDRDVIEYLAWIQLMTQHHHRSEWMLIHSTSWVHTHEMWAYTTNTLRTVDAAVDAVLWVTRGNVIVACIRTQSIRTKLFRLFPVLHPLRLALTLYWKVWNLTGVME